MASDGDIDPDALARADAAVAALSADYLRWVRADLAALTDALAVLRTAGPDHWRDCADRLAGIAHDIKGQGATFGYPLMTRLGQVVCDLLRGAATADAMLLTQLEALTAAMAEVVASGLCGDGGASGRELLARLEAHIPHLRPVG